jgi:hypothetical protein
MNERMMSSSFVFDSYRVDARANMIQIKSSSPGQSLPLIQINAMVPD